MLRPKLNRVWTSSNANLRRDPGDTKYLQGWISEIPTYQVLNYLQYKVDTTLLALAERGIFEWGTDIQYRLGSVVWDETDGKIYVAKVGSPNKTTKPSSNLTQWEASSIQVSRASYDAIVAKINAHIADITSNPHKLTAGMLNAYNKAELDSIVAQYQALVANHANNKNNPHGLTATHVGAVPVTGGAYTGDVTFQAGVYFDAAKSNKLSTASGFFLQSAAAMLGIDSTGKPVAGASSTTLSPLVTEQTFPTLKATQEPKYAVPVPDFQMDLINSLDFRYGVYTSGSGDWNPEFDAATGSLIFDNTASQAVTIPGVPDPSLVTMTAAIDVACESAITAGDKTWGWVFGTSSQRFYVQGDNALRIISSGLAPTNVSYTLPASTDFVRFVGVFSATRLQVYCNGVLVIDTAATGTAAAPANLWLAGNTRPVGSRRKYKVRNARIWYNQVLTPEQISTL